MESETRVSLVVQKTTQSVPSYLAGFGLHYDSISTAATPTVDEKPLVHVHVTSRPLVSFAAHGGMVSCEFGWYDVVARGASRCVGPLPTAVQLRSLLLARAKEMFVLEEVGMEEAGRSKSYEYTEARYYKHLPGTDEEHVVMLQSSPGGDDDGDMLLGVDGDEWAALDDNGDGDDDDDYLDGHYDLDAQAYAGDAWM